MYVSVGTRSGHPGPPGHILSGSSRFDPVYEISGSDPDILYWIMCINNVISPVKVNALSVRV